MNEGLRPRPTDYRRSGDAWTVRSSGRLFSSWSGWGAALIALIYGAVRPRSA